MYKEERFVLAHVSEVSVHGHLALWQHSASWWEQVVEETCFPHAARIKESQEGAGSQGHSPYDLTSCHWSPSIKGLTPDDLTSCHWSPSINGSTSQWCHRLAT
jgi:hypothetical protein